MADVPLGEPLPLTDQDLDDLAEITALDIETAKAFWRGNAPARFKTLLDAQTVEEDKEQP